MKNFNHAAESLLEIIISISILIMVVGPISQLIVSSIRTTTSNRDELIADPLAQEGVEVIRSIRDTNLLKFSARGTECFAALPTQDDLDRCSAPENTLRSGSYVLGVDSDPNSRNYLQWQLAPQVAALSEDLSERNVNRDASYRLFLDPASNLYNSARGNPTKFYREVVLDPRDFDEDGQNDLIFVTSRVRFFLTGRVETVTRSAVLTATTE